MYTTMEVCMKNKWIIFSILIVAEILVLSGIVLVVWQGVNQTSVGGLGAHARWYFGGSL